MPKNYETGKCSRCSHTREIAEAKTEAERIRVGKICISCIRGCEKTVTTKNGEKIVRCTFNSDGKALDRYFDAVKNRETASSVLDQLEYLRRQCVNCPLRKSKSFKGVKSDQYCAKECKTRIKIGELDGLRRCFNCKKCPSTDDMASHSGREIVSFDSTEDPDSIAVLADPLADQSTVGKRDFRDFDDKTEDDDGADKGGRFTSKLSSEAEEILREEIANYSSQLDLIDRELCVSLINGVTLKDFGTMEWAKKYVKILSRPLTRQAMYGRYKKICKAMPILKSVAHGTIGKGKGGGCKKPKPKKVVQETFTF